MPPGHVVMKRRINLSPKSPRKKFGGYRWFIPQSRRLKLRFTNAAHVAHPRDHDLARVFHMQSRPVDPIRHQPSRLFALICDLWMEAPFAICRTAKGIILSCGIVPILHDFGIVQSILAKVDSRG
jgi:hypothetical protein